MPSAPHTDGIWTFRSKLLALALAAVAPALVMGLVDSMSYLTHMRQQAFNQVEVTASLAAQQTQEFVRATESLLNSLGEVEAIKAGAPDARDRTLSAIASGYDRYNALFFITPDGLERGISTYEPGQPRLEAGHREYVQEALQTGVFVISREPVVAQSTGAPVVPMVAPVRDSGGHLIGLVGAGVRLTRIQAAWQRLPLPAGTRVSLVDRSQGLGVIRSRDGTQFGGIPLAPDLADQLRSGGIAPFERRDALGAEWIVATEPVEGTPWSAMVEVPADVVLANWRASLVRTSTLLILALLAAAGLAILLASHLARPARALARGAEALASGDLTYRVDAGGSDELGIVARQFNTMAAELEQDRATLERRVADATAAERQRTRELAEEKAAIERLRDIGAVLAAELDLDRLLQAITDTATAVSGAEFGAFFYNRPTGQDEAYSLYTLSGVPRTAFERFPMPRGTAVFGPTYRGEATVRSDDITRDPRYGQNAPYFGMPSGHLPVRSYLAVPVFSRSGEVLGGLFFGHARAGVFGEREERLVQGVAGHAAVALDNARLYDAEQRARAEAESAVHLREEFLAIAAHELKTPLTGLLGYLQLLARRLDRGELDPGQLGQALKRAEVAGVRLKQLVNDLLDISRLQRGRLIPRPEHVDMLVVLHEAVETVSDTWSQSQFTLVAPERPVDAQGSPGRLHQVFVNLLDNAAKYSPQGGRVTVRLQSSGEEIQVDVIDQGIGFTPDAAERIFEPFGRAANATGLQIQGMGLGLHLSRAIVEAHGGRLWAESSGEGQGSAFHVVLPTSWRGGPSSTSD